MAVRLPKPTLDGLLEGPPPLVLNVYDKTYSRKGPVGGLLSVSGAIRRNALGQFEFTVDADAQRVPDLTTPGARCTVDYRPTGRVGLSRIYSGRVSETEGSGILATSERTFQILDDFSVFNYLPGLVNPTDTDPNLSNQKDIGDKSYYTKTGPAEDVLVDIVSKNAGWAGLVLNVPASAHRGATVTIAVRMSNLADKLFPAMETAGLNVQVLQLPGSSTRTVVVTQPTVRPGVITEESQIVDDVKLSVVDPTVTRMIVAEGADNGITRMYRVYKDAARETALGEIITGFAEVNGDAIDLPDLMAQAGADGLAAGAGQVSLEVPLVENDTWRFGRTFQLGDQVSVRPAGSTATLTDYVREVGFEWNADDGLTVTPVVGAWEQSEDATLQRAVAGIARAVRERTRSR